MAPLFSERRYFDPRYKPLGGEVPDGALAFTSDDDDEGATNEAPRLVTAPGARGRRPMPQVIE